MADLLPADKAVAEFIEMLRLVFVGIMTEQTGIVWSVTARREHWDFQFKATCGEFSLTTQSLDFMKQSSLAEWIAILKEQSKFILVAQSRARQIRNPNV